MGKKRIGLARTQALIEALKRSIDWNGSTLTDVVVNTSKDVTVSGTTTLSGTNSLEGTTTASSTFQATGATSNAAGTGITSGTGTLVKTSVVHCGNMIVTKIFIDLTGLRADGNGKVVGVNGGTANCHLGQVTAAKNGTIVKGTMYCCEVPNAEPNMTLFETTAATLAEGAAASGLAGYGVLYARGSDWAAGEEKILSAVPTADSYLALTTGDSAAASYTQGQFIITLWGYAS